MMNLRIVKLIMGVSSQMAKFNYFFGTALAQLLLRHTDNLSRTLQQEDMSAVEGQKIAVMVKHTLQSIHTDASFSGFWGATTKKAKEFDIEEPTLPRRRKRPMRYEAKMVKVRVIFQNLLKSTTGKFIMRLLILSYSV